MIFSIPRQRIAVALAMALATVVSTGPLAAQSPDYILTVPDVQVPEGLPGFATIMLDSSVGDDIQGMSVGLCNDPAVINPVDANQGSSITALNGGTGPDFWTDELYPEGATVAFVVSFTATSVLLPDASHEIATLEYLLVGFAGAITPLEFCGTLGSPPVLTTVVVGGTTLTPTDLNGSLEILSASAATVGVTSATGPPIGSPWSVAVELGAVDTVTGFTFGLSHDASVLDVVGVSIGAATAAANGGAGPDVFVTDLTPVGGNGFTVNCVVSASAVGGLPPGAGQEIVVVDYAVSPTAGPACTSTDLIFTDSLGSPSVPLTATLAGAVEPLFGFDGQFDFTAPNSTPPTGGYTLTAGSLPTASGNVVVPITLDHEGPVQAFGFGLAHDESFMTFVTAAPGIRLAAVNCGAGPDYFAAQAVVGGVVIGSVVAIQSPFIDLALPPSGDSEIVQVEYAIDPASPAPGSVVDFTDTLGDPPVVVEVTVDSVFVTPMTVPGGVGVASLFSRGDCNDDGSLNIADAVTALGTLFPSGPPSPLPCVDACDANDDGVFDIADPVQTLNVLFVMGSDPFPAPANCGVDPTADALSCDAANGCL